jgi:hypothetical protein
MTHRVSLVRSDDMYVLFAVNVDSEQPIRASSLGWRAPPHPPGAEP